MISHSGSSRPSQPSSVSPVNWLRTTSFKFGQTFFPTPNHALPTPSDSSLSSFIFNSGTLAFLTFGIVAWGVIHQLKKKNSSIPPLPPGPKPLPVLGNLLDIPTERDYETYTQWKDIYGDVIYLSALGNDIIILNSVQAATDLLDKRSLLYSDRPYIPMIHEDSLMGFNWTLIFMNYTPAWRRHRRLFAKYIPNSTSASSRHAFRSRELSSAHNLLRLFLKSSTPTGDFSDPLSYRSHLRSVFSNVLVGVAYGFDVVSGDDPHVDLCERSVQLVNYGISPGSYLVNLFPILKHIPAWMPFNHAKAHGKLVRQTHTALKDYPMSKLNAQLAAGTAGSSFATNALIDRAEALAKLQAKGTISQKETNHGSNDESVVSEDDIKHIAASMYGAGFDTTFAPLLFVVLHLLLNPSIQRKAHAELDAVLGSPNSSTFRLPSWEDRPNLPYINAILLESLRWIPPTPGGLPHALSRSFDPLTHIYDSKTSTSEPMPTKEYDTYRNWRIPRGSMVIPNIYCMLHDPEVYRDPYSFKPERFLREEYIDEKGDVRVREPEPHPTANGMFGFGRRACPGQYLADSILWIELVNLVACFELVPSLDDKGQPIDVSWAKTPVPAFVLHPPAFPCLFKPRSDIVVRKIRETDPEI